MTWGLLVQSVLAGVTNGFVYGLVGMGLAVIFRGTRLINAMQGEFGVIGGMAAVLLLDGFRWPMPVAAAGGIVGGAITGVVVETLLVRPMRRRGASEDSYLLMTLGVAFAVSASVLYFIGRDVRVLPGIGGEGILLIFDAAIRVHSVWLIGIGLAAMLALRLFFTRTLFGLSMMAASIDEDGALTTGINVPMARTVTFVLGGVVGALAGILVTPLTTVHYETGLLLTLKGFAAAILGGLANPTGAVVGGVTLGLLESLAVAAVSSGYKDVIALSALIVIMIFMPHGMLGRGGRKGG
jgi:branched-chain amino acid transport system permease protein